MFTSLQFCLRAGIFLAATVFLTHSAAAQTAHCFNSLNGPEVPCTPRSSGGGGGYAAPVYRGPSPAEVARRKRIAAGNAANNRGAAARKRGDLRAAIGYFEEAARLWPEDRKVQGNYWNAKGELAARDGNYAEAVSYYESALRYYPGHKDITKRLNSARMLVAADKSDHLAESGRWDEALSSDKEALGSCKRGWDTWFCPTIELGQQYLAVGLALSRQEWTTAGETLRAYVSAKMALPSNANLKKEEKDFFDFERAAADVLARGNVQAALVNYENMAKLEKKWATEQGNEPPKADILLLELRRQVAKQEEAKKAEQATKPNYPNPPPVYRDASTPRGYPNLKSYTPAQHAAHNDNDTGNTWAQKGDWVQALLSYQKALTQDPDGPFAKVIKENLDIAMKHVGPQKANAAPASVPAAPVKAEEKPKEIVQENCTGWMTQANGSSFRLCTDERAQRYCEQSGQADGKGAISRVSCQ